MELISMLRYSCSIHFNFYCAIAIKTKQVFRILLKRFFMFPRPLHQSPSQNFYRPIDQQATVLARSPSVPAQPAPSSPPFFAGTYIEGLVDMARQHGAFSRDDFINGFAMMMWQNVPLLPDETERARNLPVNSTQFLNTAVEKYMDLHARNHVELQTTRGEYILEEVNKEVSRFAPLPVPSHLFQYTAQNAGQKWDAAMAKAMQEWKEGCKNPASPTHSVYTEASRLANTAWNNALRMYAGKLANRIERSIMDEESPGLSQPHFTPGAGTGTGGMGPNLRQMWQEQQAFLPMPPTVPSQANLLKAEPYEADEFTSAPR